MPPDACADDIKRAFRMMAPCIMPKWNPMFMPISKQQPGAWGGGFAFGEHDIDAATCRDFFAFFDHLFNLRAELGV